MLTLHHHPRSIYARRVVMALAEKAIPHQVVLVDMAAREHKSPAFRALNPYGRVPVLTDETGFVLYESTAILDYLEDIHPTPPLLPADPKQRALARMHVKLCDLEMGRNITTIIFPKRFLPPEKWDRPAMDQAKAAIEKHLAILDEHLAGKTYLVAEQFTVADLCYVPFLEFLGLMDITPPPHVAPWCERILTRPSALASKPDA